MYLLVFTPVGCVGERRLQGDYEVLICRQMPRYSERSKQLNISPDVQSINLLKHKAQVSVSDTLNMKEDTAETQTVARCLK